MDYGGVVVAVARFNCVVLHRAKGLGDLKDCSRPTPYKFQSEVKKRPSTSVDVQGLLQNSDF